MGKIKLSEAQKRALEWLPSDGAEVKDTDSVFPALLELENQQPPLVECNAWDWCSWRLTPAGITLKAELFP